MEYWLWLKTIKGLGPITGKRLLARLGCPKTVYAAGKDELLTVKGIGEVLANEIISSRSLDKAYSILDECAKMGIRLLTYADPLYPDPAKRSAAAPFLLYYKGSIRRNMEAVTIVGSRRCSGYGKEIALSAAEYLAKNNIPVISGMAKGIDSYAHISCLKNGGYTIAFLGNGLDICYPSEHKKLMEAIVDHGAVISEYPPGTRPRAEYFPKRNILISSWSKKVLVVEAAEKSGALITANHALAQGKELYVPPHEIYNSSGKGSNKLLLKGATIYLHPTQLLIKDCFDLTKSDGPTKSNSSSLPPLGNMGNMGRTRKISDGIQEKGSLSAVDQKILNCLTEKAKTIEEIGIDVQINFSELIERISILELEGKINSVAGGKYGRADGTRPLTL